MIAISATIPAQVTSEGLQNLLSHAIELENSKDYAGAERVYREALLASADDPEILKRLGLVCQQQGKYDESIEIFQRILRRAPVYPGVNSLLAISYYSLNKFGETIEASRKELTGNPKDKQARYYLALALSASGQLFEAIQQLEGLQAEDPQNLAVVYQLVVDYKAAAQQTGQRLVKMAPDSEFAHAMRAEALADGERFDQAIVEFKEALRKNPDFPGIHLAMAGDDQRALQVFKKALERDPSYKEVHFQLQELYARLGNKEKSLEHLQVFERLTREDQNRDRGLLQKSVTKQQD